KNLSKTQCMICPNCGRYSVGQVFCTYTQLVLFFIPMLRWNIKYYVRMECCGAVFELEKDIGKQIENGFVVDVQSSLTNATVVHKDETGYCPHCGMPLEESFRYCPYCGNDRQV
ncbi:MAG: zinc ribbon domain-containing protein, partial [Oscillospiraceae bacterium]|nr:zinc ribbon domain-containing protein [Oscillospiraceae bacterium]